MDRRIIAVVNSKGGVGRTTLVMWLGGYLAAAGLRVLLIDNDPRWDLSRQLKVRRPLNGCVDPNSLAWVLALYRSREIPTKKEIIYETPYRNLFLIPSGPALSFCEKHGPPLDQDLDFGMTAYLNTIKHYFDILLIDCPSWHGALSGAALMAADAALIPTQASELGDSALADTLELVEGMRTTHNPKLRLAGVVVTMRARGWPMQARHETHLRSILGVRVFSTVVPYLAAFAQSPVPDHSGRMDFKSGNSRDLEPDLELLSNELLSRLGSQMRVVNGKLSPLDAVAPHQCDEEFAWDVGC